MSGAGTYGMTPKLSSALFVTMAELKCHNDQEVCLFEWLASDTCL